MLKTETLFRAAVLDPASNGIDVAAGTARLSFSSEHPVLRRNDPKYGTHIEILSHAPGDVNNAIVTRGAPVLFDHRDSLVIGSVQPGTFEIGSDRKARATIQVDEEWRPYLRKVRDGEAPNSVSVGYSTIAVLKREQGSDGIPILTFSWLPEEISLLTKGNPPADPKVGIGRSLMKNGIDELLALALSGARRDPADDFSDVSLVQTIAELNMEPTGRVAEMHRALERTGETGRGVPFSLFGTPRQTRDSQTSIPSAGGAFVADDMQPGTPVLFNASVLRRLGATFITGLKGNFLKPQATTAPLVKAVGEITAATANDILTRSDSVKPRRLAAQVVISNQWLKQAGPTTETYLRRTISDAVNTELGRLAIFGTGGTEEPLGILNTPGVQSALFNGVTWTKLVTCKKSLASANIPNTRTGWVTSPSSQAFLESTPQIAGFPRYLIEQGEILNAPELASNQLADSNQLVYSSAWDSLLVLIWGDGLWFVSDPYSRAPQGETILTACMLFNILPQYPQAFVVSADAANA